MIATSTTPIRRFTLPRRAHLSRWLLVLAAGALWAPTTSAQRITRATDSSRELQRSNGQVLVSLFSGEFQDYRASVSFHEPPPSIRAEWRDPHTAVASAQWVLYRPDPQRPGGATVIASGDVQNPPAQAGRSTYFTIPLGSHLPQANSTNSAVEYRLLMVWAPRTRVASQASEPRIARRNRPRATQSQPSEMTDLSEMPDGTRTSYATMVHHPSSSRPEGTEFGILGTRPELLHTLPISVDLQTLRATGDTDIEPYLLVALVLGDGETIIPRVNLAEAKVEFPDSRVRVLGASRTHGNVLNGSDMDDGQQVAIPTDTGHFEFTLRPVGIQLASEFSLTDRQLRRLRESTEFGILVVGMEEDAVPSTETVDELRALLLSEIQTEFDAIVRGVEVSIADPTNLPEISESVAEVRRVLIPRIRNAAEARSIDELAQYLVIPAAPILGLIPGVLNADDYVGTGVFTASYQDVLDGGEDGLSFTLDLSDGADEPVAYQIRGRVRIR